MGRRNANNLATTPDTIPATRVTALKLPTVPTALASYVTAKHVAGPVNKTVLTFVNCPYTFLDATAYSGLEVVDFAEGIFALLGAALNLTVTTHSALASTLNTGVTVQIGLGTATASATTLATTMIDLVPGTAQTVPTFTASTTIDVAPAAATAYLKAVAIFDGSATAKKGYLNLACGTGTDIDADASLLVNGTITLVYATIGDY